MSFDEWIDEINKILAKSGLSCREEWVEAAREGWRVGYTQGRLDAENGRSEEG